MDTKIKLDDVLFVKIVPVGIYGNFDMHIFFRDDSSPFSFEARGAKIPVAQRFLEAFERRGAQMRYTGGRGYLLTGPGWTPEAQQKVLRKVMETALGQLFEVVPIGKDEQQNDEPLSA